MVASGVDLHWRFSSRNVADRRRGYKYAGKDAVSAANRLASPLRSGAVTESDLQAIQERRLPPLRFTQWLQLTIQKRIISRVLESRQRPKPPLDRPLHHRNHRPALLRLRSGIIELSFSRKARPRAGFDVLPQQNCTLPLARSSLVCLLALICSPQPAAAGAATRLAPLAHHRRTSRLKAMSEESPLSGGIKREEPGGRVATSPKAAEFLLFLAPPARSQVSRPIYCAAQTSPPPRSCSPWCRGQTACLGLYPSAATDAIH